MKVNNNSNDNEWYYNCDKVFNDCLYYLQNDVLSLAFILQKQILSYNDVIDKVITTYEQKTGTSLGLDMSKTIPITKQVSSAGMSWSIYNYIFKNLVEKHKIGTFDNGRLKQFLRRSIHGG